MPRIWCSADVPDPTHPERWVEVPAVCEIASTGDPLQVILAIWAGGHEQGMRQIHLSLQFTPDQAKALKMHTVMKCGTVIRLAKDYPDAGKRAIEYQHDRDPVMEENAALRRRITALESTIAEGEIDAT